MHALLIIDVQNDFIDGSLALRECDAKQDGAEVIPVINELRRAADFDAVAVSLDWHPHVHCSFFECFKGGANPTPMHPSEDASKRESAQLFDEVKLIEPTMEALLDRNEGGDGADGGGAEAIKVSGDGAEPVEMSQVLWPRHCVQNTWGACPHPDLRQDPDDFIVKKGTHSGVDSYSAFYDNSKLQPTNMLKELQARGVTHVYICGLALDVCVAYTALHAREAGFVTSVVIDACRGVDNENIASQLEAMEAAHVKIVKSDEVPDILNRDMVAALDEAIIAGMEREAPLKPQEATAFPKHSRHSQATLDSSRNSSVRRGSSHRCGGSERHSYGGIEEPANPLPETSTRRGVASMLSQMTPSLPRSAASGSSFCASRQNSRQTQARGSTQMDKVWF